MDRLNGRGTNIDQTHKLRYYTIRYHFSLSRHRLTVRTPRFQCGNRGSIPRGGKICEEERFW